MKVGVIAGTPVDTKMGVDYMISKGHEALGCFCSKNPQEQTRMQVFHSEELAKKAVLFGQKMLSEGATSILIYCNSMSGAIDMNYVRAQLKVKVVTPLDVYEECAASFHRLGVLAANGQSLAAIEKVINGRNPQCCVFGAGILPVVTAIESGKPPWDIYQNLELEKLVDSLIAMDCDALILGCTHFPYLLKEIKQHCPVPVINPSDRMIEMLEGK